MYKQDSALDNLQELIYHKTQLTLSSVCGGAGGVIIIIVGNGYCDQSTKPGRDFLHFTETKYPKEKNEANYFTSSYR